MSSKKCVVTGCLSHSSKPEDAETTFHKFPQKLEFRKKWITAMKSSIDPALQPSSSNLICSRHFLKEDYQEIKGGKVLLRQGVMPRLFPWTKEEEKQKILASAVNKDAEKEETESKDTSMNDSASKSSKSKRPARESIKSRKSLASKATKNDSKIESGKIDKKDEKAESSKDIEEAEVKDKSIEKIEPQKEVPVAPVASSKSKASLKKNKYKRRYKDKRRGSHLTSAKKGHKYKISMAAFKAKTKIPARPIHNSPKKFPNSINFASGTKLEAQDFEGRWHEAKIIEVDNDEREVLIHFEKNDKAKIQVTLSDEWIPMDSCRLRPVQTMKKGEPFMVGEKCMARWNDSRKFPATVQRIVEDDLYEVLFNDGYVKIVRGTHMTKLKQPLGFTAPIEPITPITPIPQTLAISDIVIPDIPKDGEWSCYWINDCPVGKNSYLDVSHGRIDTVVVDDWRLPDGWTKHLFQRIGNYGGKWDTILVSPDGQKFRSKQELKAYLDTKKEIYDPERYDFCLHKKRAKAIGLLTYTDDYKNALNLEIKNQSLNSTLGSPTTPGGPIPNANGEVYVGAVKVKIVDNLYLCPDCEKTFRKENHLQIHIKHYHEKTAELLGVCPNMQDLAYLRTAADVEVQEAQTKFMKKSLQAVGSPPATGSGAAPAVSSTPVTSKTSPTKNTSKNLSKRLLSEAAIKREAVVRLEQLDVSDVKMEVSSSSKPDESFDPESFIVSHELNRKDLKKRKSTVSTRHCGKKPSIKRPKLSESSTVLTDSDDTRLSFGVNDSYHPKISRLQSDNTEGSNSFGEASPSPSNYVNEYGEMIKIVRMKKEEIINCICAYSEEDGLMIQCELCLCWQHGICNGIVKESQVPEKYVCLICRNPQRGRPSMRFVHDQDWLYDGKLPTGGYHLPYPKTQERFHILKQSHTLTGNLLELKKFLHSLDVKINIASNKDHPKMYLWSKKWEGSPIKQEAKVASNPQPLNVDSDMKFDIKDIKELNNVGDNGQNNSILAGLLSSPGGTNQATPPVVKASEPENVTIKDDDKQQPTAPEPEAAIDPAKCQYNLLEHIQKQQNMAMARLQTIEAQIIALEGMDDQKDVLEPSHVNNSYPRTKKVIHQLIKDMAKMKALAEIHASVSNY